jgi:hypothetical protein
VVEGSGGVRLDLARVVSAGHPQQEGPDVAGTVDLIECSLLSTGELAPLPVVGALHEDRCAPFGDQSAEAHVQGIADRREGVDGRIAIAHLQLREGLLRKTGAAGEVADAEAALQPEPSHVPGYELTALHRFAPPGRHL